MDIFNLIQKGYSVVGYEVVSIHIDNQTNERVKRLLMLGYVPYGQPIHSQDRIIQVMCLYKQPSTKIIDY